MSDFLILALIPAAVLLSCAAVAAMMMAWPLPRHRGLVTTDQLPQPRSFTFRDGYLVASERGAFLLPEPVNNLTAWADLRDALSDLAPGAGAAMDALDQRGEGFRIEGHLGTDRLSVVGLRDGDETRLTVAARDKGQDSVRIDLATLSALETEADLLKTSQSLSPLLAWVLDGEGRVIWANARYREELRGTLGPQAADHWPLPVLFPEGGEPIAGAARRSLGGAAGKAERWFEVTTGELIAGRRHVHAQPLTRLIEAETSLRTFLQTLTRTFSALPTGLAIFDARRQLVMFNPPLLDMTGLDGAWLSSRPQLVDVLDALREHQRLPEPRDWRVWRDELMGAVDGDPGRPWRESWTLPGGQSLRMTARPQADGAVAILLEDVSAEMALARRRRSDEGVLTALLDSSDEAFAAFGADGEVLHLNVHMRDLTGFGPDTTPDRDAVLSRWATLCRPSPLWGEIRDVARDRAIASGWSDTIHLSNGQTLPVQVRPLPEGRLALRIHGDLAAAQGLMRPVSDGAEAMDGRAISAAAEDATRRIFQTAGVGLDVTSPPSLIEVAEAPASYTVEPSAAAGERAAG